MITPTYLCNRHHDLFLTSFITEQKAPRGAGTPPFCSPQAPRTSTPLPAPVAQGGPPSACSPGSHEPQHAGGPHVHGDLCSADCPSPSVHPSVCWCPLGLSPRPATVSSAALAAVTPAGVPCLGGLGALSWGAVAGSHAGARPSGGRPACEGLCSRGPRSGAATQGTELEGLHLLHTPRAPPVSTSQRISHSFLKSSSRFQCMQFSHLIFFLILFIHERPRERQRPRQREQQAPCGEPNVGRDPGTRGHGLSRQQMLDR